MKKNVADWKYKKSRKILLIKASNKYTTNIKPLEKN